VTFSVFESSCHLLLLYQSNHSKDQQKRIRGMKKCFKTHFYLDSFSSHCFIYTKFCFQKVNILIKSPRCTFENSFKRLDKGFWLRVPEGIIL